MAIHCEHSEAGGCDGDVLAYWLKGGGDRIAVLCGEHRKTRDDVAVKDWGDLVFPAARTEEIVGLYREVAAAKAAFVQRYDADAKCVSAARGGCSGGVTSYYFSSGETRFLCEGHGKDAPVMMSEQYYNEVYDKSFGFVDICDDALRESREVALASKKEG